MTLVIFDCDGVLIDSEMLNCAVVAEAFGEVGYAVSAEEVASRFAGVSQPPCSRPWRPRWGARCRTGLRNTSKRSNRPDTGPTCGPSTAWPMC